MMPLIGWGVTFAMSALAPPRTASTHSHNAAAAREFSRHASTRAASSPCISVSGLRITSSVSIFPASARNASISTALAASAKPPGLRASALNDLNPFHPELDPFFFDGGGRPKMKFAALHTAYAGTGRLLHAASMRIESASSFASKMDAT